MPTWDVRFDLHVEWSSAQIVGLLARTGDLAGVLRSLPVSPDARARLDNLNIVRAVWGTTSIEGSTLTQDEVAGALGAADVVARPDSRRARFEQEARNAAAVMQYIRATLRAEPQAPVTEDLIRAIHRITTRRIEYEHNDPGRYRSHAVTVGRYTPPRDRDAIERLMSEFVRWVNGPSTSGWPAPITAVAAHFYLVSIHPFGDGNGRTSRAIESFLLYQGGINALGFYSLSNFYYEHQDEYRRLLDRTIFGSDNNLMPFVTFALEGLVAELGSVYGEAVAEVRTTTFREVASERIERARLHARTRVRLRELLRFLEEPVAISEVQSGRHSAALLYRTLSDKTLRRDLATLQRLALIVTESGSVGANFALLDDAHRPP